MQTPKVSSIVERLANWEIRKVLVAKSYHLTLSDESSELVLAGIAQLAELNTCHFCPNGWSKIIGSNSLCQKLRIACISIHARVFVLELLKWWIFLVAPCWEIVSILYSRQKTEIGMRWRSYLGSFVAIDTLLFRFLFVSYWSQFFVWTNATCELHRRGVDGLARDSGSLSCRRGHIYR